jgi:basic amino acid/polyamine antiporter, APA family
MADLHRKLFRIKDLGSLMTDITETGESPHHLRRVLGPLDLVLLGVGVIVGAGIFTVVGTAAAGDALRPGAGPSLMLSFLITAVACSFAAICYAEFASLVPISGSAYTYSYATFGELVAWIIGWDLILEYTVGSIAVAIGWSGYFNGLLRNLGIPLPTWLTIDYRSALGGFHKAQALLDSGTPLDQLPAGLLTACNAVQNSPHIFGVPVICNISACLIIAILTTILVIGVKESARFNIVVVATKLLVLLFFVLVGISCIKPGNWIPFAPNGFSGIWTGASIVFFAYIGFDCVSTLSEEARNPKRDMPIGIIGSLVACTIIYVVVTAVFTGLVPFSLLKDSIATTKAEPLAFALNHVNLGWAAGIIGSGGIVALTAVLLVLQLGQARIFFSMSRDGLLPRVFSTVHPRFRTPYINTILIGIVVALVAMFTNIDEMVDLVNIGTLFAFVLVCGGVIALRFRVPHMPRGFKVPLGPVIPVLGIASCVFLMTGLPSITWYRFLIWLALGLVVYFSYSHRHSVLQKKPD